MWRESENEIELGTFSNAKELAMNLFDDFLGFFVITSPLWVVSLVFIVALMIGFKIAKRSKTKSVKVIGGTGIFLLFVLILFGDEITGKIYFKYLCSSKAGDKIYQTVELPGEYWGGDGKPKYYGKNGTVDLKIFSGRFKWKRVREFHVDSIIKIEEIRSQLIDTKSQITLGEQVTYLRHFGWLNRFSPAPNVGEVCSHLWVGSSEVIAKKYRDEGVNFFKKIFIRPKNNS